MKKIVVMVMLWTLVGCKTGYQKEQYFKEVISEKPVSLSMREEYFDGKRIDTLVINIPLEFALDINYKDVKDVRIYFEKNHKKLMQVNEFLVYNGTTNQPLFAIEDLEYPNYPKSIYIVDRTMSITKDQAREMLSKYRIPHTIEEIKSREDTITLVPYRQWRKDYPKFLEYMRIEPDSLKLSIGFSKGRTKVVKEPIHW